MPLFRYRAIATNGKEMKGAIDADCLETAKEKLRKQQFLITSLTYLQNKQKEPVLTPALLLIFTKELSQLLKAGLPLYESLLTIEEKHVRHKAHSLFLDLCHRLKEGYPLSESLKKYPHTFDAIYISMVHIAEQSGKLVSTFEQLVQIIAHQQKMRKQLKSALTYPGVLFCFSFLIALGLLLFVIPSMKELFQDRSLHSVTAFVLGLSNQLNQHMWTFFLSILILCTATVFAGKKFFKELIYPILIQLPYVSIFLFHNALLHLSRTMAMLLSAGIPLTESIALVKKIVRHPLLEKVLIDAQQKLAQGKKLSWVCDEHPIVPALMTRMLSIAEETGKMDEAFFHLSKIYEEELEKHLAQISAFLQPIMLVALGAIIGLVVLSILIPLTDVGSFN
ncbi:MAG: type II secretion system F family protein [Chlamydiales bacterium]|jgi:general secretion pathway protein F/type IV pilus assembly protein PilC|nr:type II secretion system F family protein [Chlamydiales bacterium]